MEETRLAGVIDKNAREQIYIGLNEWKGKWRIFVRTYVPHVEEEGEWMPTKKGISLTSEEYADLRKAVEALGEDLDSVREVAVISKSKTQDVRVGLNEYRGMKLIYLRTYMEIEGEMRPTQKGVSLRAELYPQLWGGVEKLEGLISETE